MHAATGEALLDSDRWVYSGPSNPRGRHSLSIRYPFGQKAARVVGTWGSVPYLGIGERPCLVVGQSVPAIGAGDPG